MFAKSSRSRFPLILAICAFACFLQAKADTLPAKYGVFSLSDQQFIEVPALKAKSFVKPWLHDPARIEILPSEWKPSLTVEDTLHVLVYRESSSGKVTVARVSFGIKDQALILEQMGNKVGVKGLPSQSGSLAEVSIAKENDADRYVIYVVSDAGDIVNKEFWSVGFGSSPDHFDIQWAPFYCAAVSGGPDGKVFLGSTGGVYTVKQGVWTWLPLFDGNNLFKDRVRLIYCDRFGGDSLLYAVGEEGVYIASERGKRWHKLVIPGMAAASQTDLRHNQKTILLSIYTSYSGSYSCNIARSTDGGKFFEWDWKYMGGDLVSAIGVGESTLILGNTNGLEFSYFDSKKRKEKFQHVGKKELGLNESWKWRFSVLGGLKISVPRYAPIQVFAFGDGDSCLVAEFLRDNETKAVLHSMDRGITWDTLKGVGTCLGITTSPSEKSLLLLSRDSGSGKRALLKTTSFREQFERTELPLESDPVHLVADPSIPGHYVLVINDHEAWESSDFGKSWHNLLQSPFYSSTPKDK